MEASVADVESAGGDDRRGRAHVRDDSAEGLEVLLLVRRGGQLVIPPWLSHGGVAVPTDFAPSWLMWAIAVYYLRVAYGWILLDATGLRTSRLIRGRSIPWSALQSVTTRTYYGRGGRVTVVKVRTTRGWTFTLPAPRTTSYDDREFKKAVRDLQSRVRGTPELQRHRG